MIVHGEDESGQIPEIQTLAKVLHEQKIGLEVYSLDWSAANVSNVSHFHFILGLDPLLIVSNAIKQMMVGTKQIQLVLVIPIP